MFLQVVSRPTPPVSLCGRAAGPEAIQQGCQRHPVSMPEQSFRGRGHVVCHTCTSSDSSVSSLLRGIMPRTWQTAHTAEVQSCTSQRRRLSQDSLSYPGVAAEAQTNSCFSRFRDSVTEQPSQAVRMPARLSRAQPLQSACCSLLPGGVATIELPAHMALFSKGGCKNKQSLRTMP